MTQFDILVQLCRIAEKRSVRLEVASELIAQGLVTVSTFEGECLCDEGFGCWYKLSPAGESIIQNQTESGEMVN